MRNETIAVHGGYEVDATTKAVAVPIYQTVAYAFDSAAHGAALFNLEVEGYRYSRISNPTTAVLERRVAALEGGLEALSVSTGQAALHYSILNLTEIGKNIVSVPQLYGTTYTLFAHLLPSLGVHVRFAETDHHAALEKLVDEDTRAVFCESVGNPAGNICDVEALANVAHNHGLPLIVDNTVATPILLRPIDYGADIVVHSLTKFMGGHGTTLGGAIVDSGRFPWEKHAARFPMFSQPDASYHGLVYTEHFGPVAYIARCRSVYQRTTAQSCHHSARSCCSRELRRSPFGSTVTLRMQNKWPNFCVTTGGWSGSITPASRIIRIMHWRKNISAAARARSSPSEFEVGSREAASFMTRSNWLKGWSIWATPNPWRVIRPPQPIGRCLSRSSGRRA